MTEAMVVAAMNVYWPTISHTTPMYDRMRAALAAALAAAGKGQR